MILAAIIALVAIVLYMSDIDGTTTDSGREPDKQPPHIVFMMLDDAGFNDVSWNNAEVYMPTIDSLAKDGLILDQHYTQPVCTPSRTAFLTGMYPFHSGDQHFILLPWTPACGARFHRLLPEKLRDVGYKSYAFGKWHLGYCHASCTPLSRGFDSFAGFHNGEITHYNLSIHNRPDWYDNSTLNRVDVGTYSTVPDRYLSRFPKDMPEIRRRYLGMLHAVDESVGSIVEGLKNKGLWEDTTLIFLSDNGGDFVGIPLASSNAPLRGGKGSLYEGGQRTPAFIRTSRMEHRGTVTDGLFHISDWHATIMSLAGIENEDGLDGLDQTTLLFEGGPSVRDELVYNIDLHDDPLFGYAAIRKGDYKLILGFPGKLDGWEQDETLGISVMSNFLLPDTPATGQERPASDLSGYINYQWIMKAYRTSNYARKVNGSVLLFDLKDDPEERHNIAETHPDKVVEMKARIEELLKGYVAPHPFVNFDFPPSMYTGQDGVWGVGWCPAPW